MAAIPAIRRDIGPDLGIRFPDKIMRGPDAAWLSAKRWSELSAREREIFLAFCPEFVAELRSASDRASFSEAKDGILDGPRRAAWVAYRPQAEAGHDLPSGTEPETLLQPEFLHGDGPLSGFRLEMRHFWESAQS